MPMSMGGAMNPMTSVDPAQVSFLFIYFLFLKGCPGWEANLRSFDFVYFLIPLLYSSATAAPQMSFL
jgi:hypothetical protein